MAYRSNGGEREGQITQPLGRHRGRTVHISVRADPSLAADAPEEFAVTLFVARSDGSSVEIARIDTADAGAHYDRLYLPDGHPLRKDYGIEAVDYRDAQRTLLANWRELLEEFERNHGLPDADDG